MIELNANYRDRMAYLLFGVIGLLILPFSVWALLAGYYLLAIPPAITAIVSLANSLFYRSTQKFLLPPVVISLFYTIDNVLVINELGAPGVYWSYPTMLAFYWVHSRKTAQQIVPLLYVSVCLTAYVTLPIEYTIRIAVTLFMMGVFIHIASGLMEQQYDNLKRLSVTDHLTGAFNRRYMDSKIDELIERQKRSDTCSTMINLDIDHFKKINDLFGHSSGDKVLIEIVNLLEARVRVLDKVCRAGGEEFVILLPDTEEQQAFKLADDIRAAICESHFLKEEKVTVSCGIASLIAGDDRDTWLKRSDQALYKAKENGRNTVVVSSNETHEAFA